MVAQTPPTVDYHQTIAERREGGRERGREGEREGERERGGRGEGGEGERGREGGREGRREGDMEGGGGGREGGREGGGTYMYVLTHMGKTHAIQTKLSCIVDSCPSCNEDDQDKQVS